VSLFHVMSYQPCEADLRRAFAAARGRLKGGALFVFDFWHGPAVLACGPARRCRTVEDEAWHVVRHTTPLWEREQDVVRVRFDLEVTEKATGTRTDITEEHVMRYLFVPDLERLLVETGFNLLESGEWLTGQPLSSDSFNGYVVARAVSAGP
jgi:hypothetical protein